jgi:hypothetical protein
VAVAALKNVKPLDPGLAGLGKTWIITDADRKGCAGERKEAQSHGVFSHNLKVLERNTQLLAPRRSAAAKARGFLLIAGTIVFHPARLAEHNRVVLKSASSSPISAEPAEPTSLPLRFAPTMDKARWHRKRAGAPPE